MDTSFVWILMVAGAAVILLGLVLLASERELKAKRRQIEELVAKLESLAATGAPAMSRPQDQHVESSELETKARAETQESHDRLLAEVSTLKQMLDASETRVRDLEAAQRKLADLERIEGQHRHERESFQERIAGLEARLLTDQVKVSELQSMSERLAESQSAQASLQEEIRRQEAENHRCQARMAAVEEQGQRIAALQRPCNELLSKQAALIESQRRLQEDLASFARLLGQIQPIESPASVSDTGNGSVRNDPQAAPEASPRPLTDSKQK